jgi:hypothetical protein
MNGDDALFSSIKSFFLFILLPSPSTAVLALLYYFHLTQHGLTFAVTNFIPLVLTFYFTIYTLFIIHCHPLTSLLHLYLSKSLIKDLVRQMLDT